MDQAHAATPHINYRKIYITLVILLAISVAGPITGVKWIVLITSFGIAIVKANLVVENFMHLKWERRIAKFVLAAALVLMAVFFFGIAPDVMRHTGQNWVNNAAIAAVDRGIPNPDSAGTPKEQRERAEEERKAGIVVAAGGGGAAAGGAATAGATPPAAGGFNPAQTFQQNCTPCHGPQGGGNGPVAASLNPKPANFTSAAFWQGKNDAELVKAIREGGASVGRSASMPAWGSIISPDQATQMVAYLKTLKH